MFNILLRSYFAFFFFELLDIFKSHESNYALESVRKVCKQGIEIYNNLRKV